MTPKQAVQSWSDEERAEAIRDLLGGMLGPKSLDAQTSILPSCAREFIIVEKAPWWKWWEASRILLFLRPPGIRYERVWHFSGTTVQKRRTGREPWDFVREKYRLNQARLSEPIEIGFLVIEKGEGEDQCEFGDVWTLLNVVYWQGGKVPDGSAWFSIDDLPEAIIPYHRHVLVERVKKYLRR